MDFGRAFTFLFDDPDWLQKVGLVALISLIPILGWLVMLGWSLRIARRVMARQPHPLPSLEFGLDLVLGIKALVVFLLYSIPLILIWIPVTIGLVSASDNGTDPLAVGLMFAILCFGFLSLVYSILIAFLVPASLSLLAEKDDLAAGLRVGDAWRLVRRQPGAYLVVVAGTFVSGLLAQLGGIACIIGAAITYAYAHAVNGHLYGQAYLEAAGIQQPPAQPPQFPYTGEPTGPPPPPIDLPPAY